MQIQDRSTQTDAEKTVEKAWTQSAAGIAAAQNYLFSLQNPEGYWWAELEANVTITAEILLLHKIWGTDTSRNLHKIKAYLTSQQRDHGGWELFYGDGGNLSTSVEAYMALRLLDVPKDDPVLVKAREFILQRGGITKTRIFTKLHLALIGCYDWRGVPSIPPWVMLLPQSFPIYEMSSWARSSTVPLLIVFDQKPVYNLNPNINLDELYCEGVENVKYELPRNNDWTDIFVWLDDLFKLAESFNVVPFREEGKKAAEKWILERYEATGDIGGIIPAMLNSLLALRGLNYDVNDPMVVKGIAAIDRWVMETETSYHVQCCVSPVWDTAWSLKALVESGVKPNHPALVRGGEWLLEQQVLSYGDWSVKNKQGKPGGWAFEFQNSFYPDLDDSGVVVMTLSQLQLPDEKRKEGAIARCVAWMESMQCQAGGWAAFDINNNSHWLNYLPYADLKAMIDPNTADVTARVLEMVGCCDVTMAENRVERALKYLLNEQEADGSWFGRWGVNYIYGTSGALAALAVVSPEKHPDSLLRGASWLVSCQNSDGGWGETCRSYDNPSLKGKGVSTASQTAWALIGLIAVGEATNKWEKRAIIQGVEYLLQTQQTNGSWEEAEFTGTGFPGHFYIRYHLYRHYFPLIALGRFRGCCLFV